MLRTFLLAIVPSLVLAPLAPAQVAPPWDRGISNVARLNGLPPGTRYIGNIAIHVTTDPTAPSPLDLSSELRATLNGNPVQVATVTESLTKLGGLSDCALVNCVTPSCADWLHN